MYGVKPGRGPSMMGVVGGIAAAVFGVIWMARAASAGAPTEFVLFGIVFVGIAIAGVAYNAYNAPQKDRMCTFDITNAARTSDRLRTSLRRTIVHEDSGN